ncbi:calcium-binding protein [Phenylobacterium sp.]|uniref:calcium-binding protein n=1 Tax=Phenylobacterium sp. TaxID=1871053 RepID=UPI003BAA9825
MTTVTAGTIALNFDQLSVQSLLSGIVTFASATQISTSDSGYTDNFFGSFTYNGQGLLTGGTLTRLQETYLGQVLFDISNTSVSMATFIQWAEIDDTASAKAYILAGADSISGSTLGDVLRAYTGADSMAGGSGNDTLDGGAGADVINGNDGDDVILGGADANYLRGDTGNDSIVGGANFDDINGNQGDDTLRGGEGFDWVVGGQANDMLYGENGGDIVYGNLGNDTQFGGEGEDWVRGGQGNDSLDGGGGNDLMWGDRGDDTVAGGTGADTFHAFVGGGLDRITDFNYAEGDRLVLDFAPPYTVSQVGSDTVVDLGGSDRVVLVNVTLSSLPGGWISLG